MGASTYLAASTSILSQLSSMRFAPAPTASSTTQSSLSLARRTQPTTTLVATTPWARRSSTSLSTVFVSSLTSAPVSRASSSSTLLAEVPALALAPCSSSVCLSTTARSPSSDSAPTHPHRFPLLLSSHTTPCLPPTPSLSTLTLPSCLTTRPSTTSVVAASTSSVQPTPT